MSIIHKLPYEWLVGLRYTRAGKRSGRNRFISFISLISVAGIALGVAALIVVLSVMNGFQKEVTDRMLSVLAHVEIYDLRGAMPNWQQVERDARRNPQVAAAAPFVELQGMLLRDGVMKPVLMRGVLPSAEVTVSDVAKQMRQGSLASLRPGSMNVVLGSALAKNLGVQPGERITMLLASGSGSGGGTQNALPRTRTFVVSGIFEAGHYEFDSALAFAHLDDAAMAAQVNGPSGLRLRLHDMHQAPRVAAELRRSMGGELVMRDWSQVNSIWFAAVGSQKRMMFIILAMIIAVAAFNLVSTLVMTVKDKQADIAILRTLGASPRSIMKIFVVQGTLVGILGAALGVAMGVLVALNVDVIVPLIERVLGVQFLSKEIYLISEIPSDLRWPDVLAIGGFAVLLAFLATLYPSWAAARVKPAEALRYE
ncbi:lipoprotein-releasing ABC transporter permease subunit [Massilia sp. Dwa41.01b]|uniref:lipoprotein-releasing ABC transporter permease subunit n=1 Tax=unclassified Massilia TaxID=2609279 RepID=UPI001600F67E|nr:MULTISPECIES: lipoprotein-releasing ABC transporter permease subunit [unclassified Massilia]QNA88940.1 lipoprotein-releasing ABC transporter permease subunit [Massilia sp. Dwa41.01b]QNA99829.1 lipoprotein-releasing ABC transporter permease subunit [Massilia sp. Se16.2.3]